jgi:hypothetical protein
MDAQHNFHKPAFETAAMTRTMKEKSMSKLKIEHGISRVKRAKLQTYIDQTIADDIALMADWTNNEQHYVINELLRFALMQSEDFQRFKTEQGPEQPLFMRGERALSLAASANRKSGTNTPKNLPEQLSKPITDAPAPGAKV